MLRDPTKRVRIVEDGEREYPASLFHTGYEGLPSQRESRRYKRRAGLLKGNTATAMSAAAGLIFLMQ